MMSVMTKLIMIVMVKSMKLQQKIFVEIKSIMIVMDKLMMDLIVGSTPLVNHVLK